jgi:methylenetetrahydrofolate dehydrogenase (NADP+) / methenyltetrahydrofolate cyclohydrolase
MKLLDGRATAAQIQEELKAAVQLRKQAGQKIPHLAAILVGNDGGSVSYVTSKVKACEAIGFESTLIRYDETVPEDILLEKVESLNQDRSIDGFIVQLPLPKHIDELKITQAIDPKKDVDGFHPRNIGNMILNLPGFLPATPAGILELMRRNDIPTEGKNCVIIGRSNIVGNATFYYVGQKQQSWQLHRDTRALQNTQPQSPLQRCRHHHCSNWQTSFYYCRYGQRWRCHHRCGHHTRRRPKPRARMETRGRCQI